MSESLKSQTDSGSAASLSPPHSAWERRSDVSTSFNTQYHIGVFSTTNRGGASDIKTFCVRGEANNKNVEEMEVEGLVSDGWTERIKRVRVRE